MQFVAYSLFNDDSDTQDVQVEYKELYSGPDEFVAWHFVEWDSEFHEDDTRNAPYVYTGGTVTQKVD